MQFFSYANSLIIKGGPVMIPIILLSVVGWAMSAERLWKIFTLPKDEEAEGFAERIFALMDERQFLRAEAECLKFNHPLARLFKAGLAAREYPRDELRVHLEKAANIEVRHLEKFLGGILTIVGVSPMLGFLGTITGLIKSFQNWEKLAEKITVSSLAGGIYEAMITTAAGLIVAIPLYLIYQVLVGRIERITHILSDEGEEFIVRVAGHPRKTAQKEAL
ncbi:MAG: MotA/TolQ/ExbB proton channel family protein [Elusimicrobia bacterium]|nr:MotA/TolQ/ExbB proton channel family protein [Elusimicrobiota bacterium]